MQVYPTDRNGRVQLKCDYCGILFNRITSQVRWRGGEHAFCCRQHGSLFVMRPIEERFWEKVQKKEGDACWGWMGSTNDTGYGQIREQGRKGRLVLATWVSWKIVHGPVPDGMCVLHICDNPPCCRPDHLFIGTKKDNTADMMSKGRARYNSSRGEDHPMAKLSESDVRKIRILRSAGQTLKEIASHFGVTFHAVRLIVIGKTWTHVV